MENSSQIHNELKSLEDIFGFGNRIFRIPDYQRGYSWEEQQRNDLLTDIEYLIKSGNEYRHYTGTIVASRNEKESKKRGEQYEVFDIVDGQQRLTSLILLLSLICRSAKKFKDRSDQENVFSAIIKDGIEGNAVWKLKLGKEQDKLFKSLVKEGTIAAEKALTYSKSDENLKNAVKEFDKWLRHKNINEVLTCVCKQLGFLFYAPENKKEIGIMFEVINNRGKALSELEKIKNYLIYYADKNNMGEITEGVNSSWPVILSNLNKIEYTSNESEDRFLRYCWIVFMDTHKSKSHNVYDNLKVEWPPDSEVYENTKKIIKFIDFLEEAAISYAKYLKRDGVPDKLERSLLECISLHPADASITPLILAIFSRVTDQNERNTLFELLEKLNFRFYGTGIAGRSDTGQGDLFWYANKFFNKFEEIEDGEKFDVKWLKENLENFISQRANDTSFVEYLTLDKDEAGDYYNWIGLKFFLASYEEHLQNENDESIDLQRVMAPRDSVTPNDFYHKEHIWAVKDYARIEDWDNLDVNKRRLGNFLLLKENLNIKVSNNPPEDKVELYFNDWKNSPNTLMIRELKEFFELAEKKEVKSKKWRRKTTNYWLNVYKRFLDGREEKMINFALERWRVIGLNSNISKVRLDSLGSQNEIWSGTR